MLRMRSNQKRSARKKQPKPTDKTYEENYNEVILNDLVTEEDKMEFGLEESKPRAKKKSGLNFGLGKKNNSNKSNTNKKQQSKQHVEESGGHNAEPTSKKSTSGKKEQSNTDEKVKSSKKGTSSSQKNTKKSQSKKSKVDESDKNTKTQKKGNKKPKSQNSKRKIKKSNAEDDLQVKQILDDNEVTQDFSYEEELSENLNFRGNEPEPELIEDIKPIQKVEEIKPNANKLENIVWSKDSFPKN